MKGQAAWAVLASCSPAARLFVLRDASFVPLGYPQSCPLHPLQAQSAFDPAKLVGEWRYENEAQNQVARYVFRADDTFTAELFQGGESIRKFTGHWNIEEGMIIYTYETDSLEKVFAGARERDRLIRLDESSYTIEGGDGGQRSYWRMKESK